MRECRKQHFEKRDYIVADAHNAYLSMKAWRTKEYLQRKEKACGAYGDLIFIFYGRSFDVESIRALERRAHKMLNATTLERWH